MSLTVVTSWADKDADTHGHRFLAGYHRHWSPVPLRVYTDAFIERGTGYARFLLDHGHHDIHDGSFDRGAAKWARKVFALEHATVSGGTIVWIDGDVEFTAIPPADLFDGVTPVTYLGRPWRYASETGFVIFRGAGLDVIQRMADIYISGEVFDQDNWGDGYTFDRAREQLGIEGRDLCAEAGLTGPDAHVWPKTILGQCMIHHRGPGAKRRAYGC